MGVNNPYKWPYKWDFPQVITTLKPPPSNYSRPVGSNPHPLTWPLKIDGWKTILAFWDGKIYGAMINFRGVGINIPYIHPVAL